MGLYDTSDPARAGSDVAKFNGWSLINIINAFASRDLTDMDEKLALKRAILISNEYARMANMGRINA